MCSSLSQAVLCIILWGLGKKREIKQRHELPNANENIEKPEIQETEPIDQDADKQLVVAKEPKKYTIIVVPEELSQSKSAVKRRALHKLLEGMEEESEEAEEEV